MLYGKDNISQEKNALRSKKRSSSTVEKNGKLTNLNVIFLQFSNNLYRNVIKYL